MKAVLCTKYGPPEVLQLRAIEKPQPKAHEVRVKVYATTVSAADRRVRSFDVPGLFWLPARLMLGVRKPRRGILGMEISGKVEAVGSGVKNFKVGDSVFAATLQTFGGYAEYICLSADGPIALIPQNVNFEEAAAIPIGARTAFHYLKEIAKIKAQQRVLIYGASGSVGTYAVQLAKYYGARVTGVCSTANLELVKSLGADEVIDYTRRDFAKELTTYDIIFVTIDKCPFALHKKVCTRKGVYLNIGRPLPSLSMIWTALSTKKKIVVGKNAPESAAVLRHLAKMVAAEQLKVVIDRIYFLDQIVSAHHYVDQGHKKGNVVITVKKNE